MNQEMMWNNATCEIRTSFNVYHILLGKNKRTLHEQPTFEKSDLNALLSSERDNVVAFAADRQKYCNIKFWTKSPNTDINFFIYFIKNRHWPFPAVWMLTFEQRWTIWMQQTCKTYQRELVLQQTNGWLVSWTCRVEVIQDQATTQIRVETRE